MSARAIFPDVIRILVFHVVLLLSCVASAQPLFSEACSKNVAAIADGDAFPDWIELHNVGTAATIAPVQRGLFQR